MIAFNIEDKFKIVENKLSDNVNFNLWVNCYVDELLDIKQRFVLDEEAINECKDFNKGTKIEFFKNYIFIVLNIFDYYDEGVHSRELYIFLSDNYIITTFKEKLELLELLMEDIRKEKNCLLLKENADPQLILYYILDRIILKNYNVISKLEEQSDKIEIRILKNPEHKQLDDLIDLRRQVYKVRKYLNPLRYIGDSLLSNDNSIIKDTNMKYFESLNTKIDKLMMSLESLVQDLALGREAFEAEMSNKTNELMKIFTLIATIFLPLNLITSIYGMNVRHIPFVFTDYGFYYLFVIMIIVSLLLIYLFKRKKWL
ncbi:magnesium transporter CorA family protein [Clostridium peptidivorans]|uniref:magnesium transporter CorA family protein n=1 Tax=Clostridium peptidivorans TaxID=100174 RepID=UPI000BE3FF1E|nr:magnesium transporter CorA family protein [Clostridium peptidivorans]